MGRVSRAALRLVGGGRSMPDTDSTGGARQRMVEALYSRYREPLCNYVARMLPGGRQDVDVVLQETYVKLLRLENLTPLEENPRAYIFTVATNLVRDNLRRHQRRRVEFHQSFEEGDHESRDLCPQGSAEWQQSLSRLKSALLQLKPITRKVFLLSRFEEMTYPEIAAALSVSTRSVERHMSTALKHLQKELSELL
ncbi:MULTISPECIES: RNA polymerase sigma factor [Microbulbifer]|uniref:RNA polymerase sigma factor n=1 Tax=Microbulbifer celer TaxID=435905 RepID=A0ABW3U2J5_9GAMM|nr:MULTISPECIES: sigma-70 family RNA polymerase sigma factor [Microbulbifer]UFN56051.1 sigma-70 family RNA polymerase sigma factor [Microbulbifer celer]